MTNTAALTGVSLKQANRNNIYQLIWREKRISKQNIMKTLDLSLPTVTQNLNDLVNEGLVETNGTFGYTGGRSAVGYSIVPTARYAVGLDINKLHISVVVADLDGNILHSVHDHHSFRNEKSYYQRAAEHVLKSVEALHIDPKRLLDVGISMQGLVSEDRQRMVYGPILNTTDVTVGQVAEFIPYPCKLYHDAESAAFAELWVSQEIRDAVYVSLSTNLGGAVIVNREIFSGQAHMGGKLEHMTIEPRGDRCYCGEYGCAEVYCSATKLTQIASDKKLDSFFSMLKGGDESAVKCWDEYLFYLSILLNNLHMFTDTDVILGGYMASYIGEYIDEIKARTYSRNSVDKERDYIKVAQFLNEPIAAGAAFQNIHQFLQTV